ncbi:MAG: DNA/RNA nuclease SfsA [Spirochaetales bacterium]|nr:DNA/RNA nuclease SfsA [Spirochaetales bacterium]
MQLFVNHREALFLERPNRFVVLARAVGDPPGEVLAAHCPNPGRMLELLVPGRRLILQRRDTGLAYTLAAAYYQDTVVPLQSTRANALAESLLLPALFPGLQELEREVRVGGSRLDFRFRVPGRSGWMALEVKSCTLVEEGTAMFPDAATARGLRHLEELALQEREGDRAGVLFVVQNPNAKRFLPDVHTDPAFSRRLLELRERIWIGASSIRTTPAGQARLERLRVPLDFEAAARCVDDRGAYLLVLRVEKELHCRVGSLGLVRFAPGHFVYVGSAMGGLSARLARHLRKAKSHHWHIDYLLAQVPGRNVRTLPIRSPHPLECPLSREVASLAAAQVPRFGSSDCACPSHLYYFPEDPLRSERFLQLLLRFRHDLALRP